jgi:hypothetical protein
MIFILLLVLASPAAAQIGFYSCSPGAKQAHYASTNGPGGAGAACTTGSPCSLDEALARGDNDDFVIVKNGTYNRRLVTVRSGLSASAPLTICAENRLGAIFSFPNDGNFSNSATRTIVEIDHDNITVKGFELDGNTNTTGFVRGQGSPSNFVSNVTVEWNYGHDSGTVAMLNQYASNWIIRHNWWDNTGDDYVGEGFYFGSASANAPANDFQIYNNKISRTRNNTLDLKDGSNLNVHHNILENHLQTYDGFPGDGIIGANSGSETGNTLTDNIFRNSTNRYVFRFEKRIDALRNVLYNMSMSQGQLIGTDTVSSSLIKNNVLCNASTGGANSTPNWSPNLINQPQSVCDAEVRRIMGTPQIVQARCEIGLVSSTKVVCNWENLVFSPLSSALNSSFAVTYGGVAQTEISTTIVGGTATHTTLAAPPLPGQPVQIAVLAGAVQNSAFIGGTDNGSNLAQTATVTNNVTSAPPVAADYGPALEACHTTVTDPGAVTLTAAQSWQATLNAGGNGQVYLLDSSQGAFNTATVLTLKNIKVYPENCDAVTLKTTTTIALGDNSVLAGFTIDASAAPTCVIIEDDAITGDSSITGATLRNNKIFGGLSSSCVRIRSSVSDLLVEGNDINGGGTSGNTIAVQGDGRFVDCSGSEPNNITIRGNKIQKDFTTIPGWTLSNFTGTEDLFTSVAAGAVWVEDNWFLNVPSNGEEMVDAKYSCNGEETVFVRNYFQGAGHQPDTKACALVQTETAATGTVSDTAWLGNLFDQCDSNASNKEGAVFGAKDNDVFPGGFWFNIARQLTDGTSVLDFRDTENTFDVVHNTLVNGLVNFRTDGNVSQATAFSEIKDNLVFSAFWNGAANAAPTTCSHNASASSTGSLPGACTNTITTNPEFANAVLCTHLALCDFTPTSATFLAAVGSDGAVRGAAIPPVLSAAVIENTTPAQMDITITPHSSTGLGAKSYTWDTAPIDNLDVNKIKCGGIARSVCVAGGARTIVASGIIANNVIRLFLASSVGLDEVVTFDADYGWCTDSARIGGILSTRCSAVSAFAVTNNVEEPPPPAPPTGVRITGGAISGGVIQ